MCAILYLVSEQPLPAVNGDPAYPALTVHLLEPREEQPIAHRHFPWARAIAMIEVGGLCSCYFGPEPWPRHKCDDVYPVSMWESCRLGYRTLGDYLQAQLPGNRLALYKVFEGDQEKPVIEQAPQSARLFLRGESFPLALNEFRFITV